VQCNTPKEILGAFAKLRKATISFIMSVLTGAFMKTNVRL
jgi:hypothetical protein